MKKEMALKKIESGFIGFFAEYRGSRAETIQYVDKKTGRATSMSVLRHALEVNGEPILFSERTADNFKPDDYISPFKKGQIVLAGLTRYENDKGAVRASGRLEPVEA